MAKLTKRTVNQINKALHELNLVHDVLTTTYEDWDLDWHLLQVENAKSCLLNLLESGDD